MSLVLPSIHAFGNSLAKEGPMVRQLEHDTFPGSNLVLYTLGSKHICNGIVCNASVSFCMGTNQNNSNTFKAVCYEMSK